MLPLRILMLTTRFWPTIGGAQKHVLKLSQALAKLGFTVTVVAEKDPFHLHFHERICNINVYRAPIRRLLFLSFFAYIMIALLIQGKFKARIIHAHFALPCGFVGFLISRLYRIPFVITVHGIDIVKEPSVRYGIRLNPLLDRLTSWILKRADHVITCSQFTKNLVLECGVEASKISLIPNGVTVPKINSSSLFNRELYRKMLGLPTKCFLIFTARRLVPKNGVEYLVRASQILADTDLNFHVAIAGDGPLKKSLVSLSERLRVNKRISFLGEVNEVKLAQLYLASNVVVLPSIVEAFGLPVLEAMAYQRPIISFNSGGPSEIITREGVGLVVMKRSASALAQAIIRLSSEPELVRKMENACLKAIHKYGWENIAQKVAQVYYHIIKIRYS